MNKPGFTKDLQPWQIWLPLLVSFALVAGMFVGLKFQEHEPTLVVEADNADDALKFLGYGRMEELIRYIEAKYVDEVEGELLVKEAIDHLLEQLDPHSTYITKEQLKEVTEQMQGNFDGIGIEFMVLDDTIIVVSPLSGGPAEAAGILAGDKIVEISDSLIVGEGLLAEDVVRFLRGENGSEVNIGILRNGIDSLMDFTVRRAKIPSKSVDAAYMLDFNTGIIKINRFSATNYEEFMQELEAMVEGQGLENLIIDLRQNPGGFLNEATKLLSQLFDERGKLLVYTEGRSTRRTEHETTGRNFYDLKKIAVLIDEGSASASEIVAGAIQDWDRGLIVGRRSFGKGLVQEQYKLSDGSALRLTVARYYTPSGRSIQKDYSDLQEYNNDFLHRIENGELLDPSHVEVSDTTSYFTAGGRKVYGGGGISPDIFVPLDTILLNKTYISFRQYIPGFIFRYMESHPDAFADIPFTVYQEQMVPDASFFAQFLNYSREQDPKLEGLDPQQSAYHLKHYLKARLAKHLYGNEPFFIMVDKGDPVIDSVLEAFKDNKPLVERVRTK